MTVHIVLSVLSLSLSIVLILMFSLGFKLLKETIEYVKILGKDSLKTNEDLNGIINAHNTLVVAIYGDNENNSSELSDSQKDDSGYSRRN